MTEAAKDSDIQTGEFDASLIATTDQDWAIVENYKNLDDPYYRCGVIGDLAVLDPQREVGLATQKDWDFFFQFTDELRSDSDNRVFLRPWVGKMAKVDSEKARQALLPDELGRIEKTLREILEGKKNVGLFPADFQIEAIDIDPERARKTFKEVGRNAWDSERRYLDWLRRESPAHVFLLLAALSQIGSAQTLTLMEKSDWELALEGLRYYREHAGPYNIQTLVGHLAALKTLTPLFERLFQQESSS